MVKQPLYIRRKGFTLIELLVVIAIIGLLSTLAVIALGSAREKARDSKRISDLGKVQASLELYYVANNEYPVAVEPLSLGNGGAACLGSEGLGPVGCPDAIAQLLPIDPGSASYQYVSPDGVSYTIQAELEGQINGFSGKIYATPSGITNAN